MCLGSLHRRQFIMYIEREVCEIQLKTLKINYLRSFLWHFYPLTKAAIDSAEVMKYGHTHAHTHESLSGKLNQLFWNVYMKYRETLKIKWKKLPNFVYEKKKWIWLKKRKKTQNVVVDWTRWIFSILNP